MKKNIDYLDSDDYSSNEVPFERSVFNYLLGQSVLKQWATSDNAEDEKRNRRRKERLVRKIMMSATHHLTDTQFQIFIMRFVYDLREVEIARQIGCDQSYVSTVLKHSVRKIKKALRINGKKTKKGS